MRRSTLKQALARLREYILGKVTGVKLADVAISSTPGKLGCAVYFFSSTGENVFRVDMLTAPARYSVDLNGASEAETVVIRVPHVAFLTCPDPVLEHAAEPSRAENLVLIFECHAIVASRGRRIGSVSIPVEYVAKVHWTRDNICLE